MRRRDVPSSYDAAQKEPPLPPPDLPAELLPELPPAQPLPSGSRMSPDVLPALGEAPEEPAPILDELDLLPALVPEPAPAPAVATEPEAPDHVRVTTVYDSGQAADDGYQQVVLNLKVQHRSGSEPLLWGSIGVDHMGQVILTRGGVAALHEPSPDGRLISTVDGVGLAPADEPATLVRHDDEAATEPTPVAEPEPEAKPEPAAEPQMLLAPPSPALLALEELMAVSQQASDVSAEAASEPSPEIEADSTAEAAPGPEVNSHPGAQEAEVTTSTELALRESGELASREDNLPTLPEEVEEAPTTKRAVEPPPAPPTRHFSVTVVRDLSDGGDEERRIGKRQLERMPRSTQLHFASLGKESQPNDTMRDPGWATKLTLEATSFADAQKAALVINSGMMPGFRLHLEASGLDEDGTVIGYANPDDAFANSSLRDLPPEVLGSFLVSPTPQDKLNSVATRPANPFDTVYTTDGAGEATHLLGNVVDRHLVPNANSAGLTNFNLRRHTLVMGQSGLGKSRLLRLLADSILDEERADGRKTKVVMMAFGAKPPEMLAHDDCVVIDLADQDNPIPTKDPLTIEYLEDGTQENLTTKKTRLVQMFAAPFGDPKEAGGAMAERLFTTVIDNIYDKYGNPTFKNLQQEVAEYLEDQNKAAEGDSTSTWDKDRATWIQEGIAKVAPYVSSSRGKFNQRAFLDDSSGVRALIVNSGQAPDMAAHLWINMFMHDATSYLARRESNAKLQGLPSLEDEQEAPLITVLVDEAGSADSKGAEAAQVQRMVMSPLKLAKEQGRSLGLAVVTGCIPSEKLDPTLKDGAKNFISFAVQNPKAAAEAAATMGMDSTPEELKMLKKLPPQHCVVSSGGAPVVIKVDNVSSETGELLSPMLLAHKDPRELWQEHVCSLNHQHAASRLVDGTKPQTAELALATAVSTVAILAGVEADITPNRSMQLRYGMRPPSNREQTLAQIAGRPSSEVDPELATCAVMTNVSEIVDSLPPDLAYLKGDHKAEAENAMAKATLKMLAGGRLERDDRPPHGVTPKKGIVAVLEGHISPYRNQVLQVTERYLTHIQQSLKSEDPQVRAQWEGLVDKDSLPTTPRETARLTDMVTDWTMRAEADVPSAITDDGTPWTDLTPTHNMLYQVVKLAVKGLKEDNDERLRPPGLYSLTDSLGQAFGGNRVLTEDSADGGEVNGLTQYYNALAANEVDEVDPKIRERVGITVFKAMGMPTLGAKVISAANGGKPLSEPDKERAAVQLRRVLTSFEMGDRAGDTLGLLFGEELVTETMKIDPRTFKVKREKKKEEQDEDLAELPEAIQDEWAQARAQVEQTTARWKALESDTAKTLPMFSKMLTPVFQRLPEEQRREIATRMGWNQHTTVVVGNLDHVGILYNNAPHLFDALTQGEDPSSKRFASLQSIGPTIREAQRQRTAARSLDLLVRAKVGAAIAMRKNAQRARPASGEDLGSALEQAEQNVADLEARYTQLTETHDRIMGSGEGGPTQTAQQMPNPGTPPGSGNTPAR
ncbi:MAG: hypothetical protein HOQ05_10455 [Corynebacteriales bacterium]|nr:hypothetical protein [Mycobacteriales bacterium]